MSHEYSFYMATQGCKINQYETQALREEWLRRGFTEAVSVAEASVVLVNSCAVTEKAVRELRNTVRQAHRANPEGQIIITGCAAQVLRQELAALPGVVQVVPQEAKASLKAWPTVESEPAPGGGVFPPFSVHGSSRARAVVKVQDGCSHRCTYCIVPLTRGRSCSRSIAACVAEARMLLETGFREIILSGVNLRQYGRDLPGTPDFWELLQALESELAADWKGVARFRLSSLEPGQLDSRALDVLAASRLTAPQLHISLQSGSEPVLRRMGRGHYALQPIAGFFDDLRSIWPVFGLGADILMGFPGETEAEFLETVEVIRVLPFTYAHVFPYSRRPGTAASAMSGQLDKQTKAFRARVVRELVNEKKMAFLQMLVDAQLPLDVVLQSAESRNGISQYYTDCRFTNLPAEAKRREIHRGIPVAMRKGGVLISPV